MSQEKTTQSDVATNQNKSKFIDRGWAYLHPILRGIIKTSSSLIGIGVLLLIISTLTDQSKQKFQIEATINENNELNASVVEKPLKTQEKLFQAINGLCVNAGVALIAAGLVVMTVESNSHKQRQEQYEELIDKINEETQTKLESIENIAQNQINKLVESSQDSIIRTLVSDDMVFSQVKNSLIRQEFIIKDYRARISFEWCDVQNDKLLLQKNHIEYDVQNLTSSKKTYLVKLWVSNDVHLSSKVIAPQITKFTIDTNNYLNKDLRDKLEEQEEAKKSEIGFEKEIKVESESKISIVMEFDAYRRANVDEPFVLSKIADGMELTIVSHPEDIDIACTPFHSGDSFICPNNKSNVPELTWKINTGILPFQGLHLSLRHKSYNQD